MTTEPTTSDDRKYGISASLPLLATDTLSTGERLERMVF